MIFLLWNGINIVYYIILREEGAYMKCTIDIGREGNSVMAYLPFNPRTEFEIPKGSIYVICTIGGVEFKSRLMSKGNEKYCVFFSNQLLKKLGLNGEEHFNVPLDITIENKAVSEAVEPEMLENDTVRVIRERSSMRSFIDKRVSHTVLDTILYSGLCAPSATNKRPFHFTVTQDREKMLRIMESNSHYTNMLNTAAACIIVCGDKIAQGIPEWLIEDCSAATQNMLLAIHSLGLGGVWCGVRQGSDFYKNIVNEFGMPGYIRPISLIAFGYSDENRSRRNRFEPSKIHYEAW